MSTGGVILPGFLCGTFSPVFASAGNCSFDMGYHTVLRSDWAGLVSSKLRHESELMLGPAGFSMVLQIGMTEFLLMCSLEAPGITICIGLF